MDDRASRGPRCAVGATRQSTAEDLGDRRAHGRVLDAPKAGQLAGRGVEGAWCAFLDTPRFLDTPKVGQLAGADFWTHPKLASWRTAATNLACPDRRACLRSAPVRHQSFDPAQRLRPPLTERWWANWVAGHVKSAEKRLSSLNCVTGLTGWPTLYGKNAVHGPRT